jgi:hypothetical protein
MELREISLVTACDFATSDGKVAARATRTSLNGKVNLGTVLDITAAVVFLGAAPQIVVVTLNKSVTLGDLFATCIGTNAFRAPGLPTVTLLSGRIYYALANRRKCRRFSHRQKSRLGDRTGWLTTQSIANRSPHQIPC